MKKIFFGSIAFVLFIFSCKTSTGSHQTKKVSLNLESKSGSQVIGTAIFTGGFNDRVQLFMHSQTATFDEGVGVTDSLPFVFSANDKILIQLTYESQL